MMRGGARWENDAQTILNYSLEFVAESGSEMMRRTSPRMMRGYARGGENNVRPVQNNLGIRAGERRRDDALEIGKNDAPGRTPRENNARAISISLKPVPGRQ